VLADSGRPAQEAISEPPFAKDVTFQTYGSCPRRWQPTGQCGFLLCHGPILSEPESVRRRHSSNHDSI